MFVQHKACVPLALSAGLQEHAVCDIQAQAAAGWRFHDVIESYQHVVLAVSD